MEELISAEREALVSIINDAKDQLPPIDGKMKFIRSCQAELKFICSLDPDDVSCQLRLQSTNSSHLSSLLHTALSPAYLPRLTAILHKFKSHHSPSLCVDIVSADSQGYPLWAKVIARNPIGLHNVWQGCTDTTSTPLTKQARQYLQCAKQHPVMFQTPRIIFHTVNGITQPLAHRLRNLGIEISTPTTLSINEDLYDSTDDSEDEIASLQSESKLLASHDTLVNLDVSTLLVLVSDLCITGPPSQGTFMNPEYRKLVEDEKHTAAREVVLNFIKNKEVVVCQSAWNEFSKIVSTIGGPREKKMAQQLQFPIVPDRVSPRVSIVPVSSSFRDQNKIVFGTGDYLKAITTTANVKAQRSASSQGVDLAVFQHPGRALTEMAAIIPECEFDSLSISSKKRPATEMTTFELKVNG